MNFSQLAGFIWSVADLLRGDYKQSDYGKVILPFTLLRRLDCVLAPSKQAVLAAHEQYRDKPLLLDLALNNATAGSGGLRFYNTSPLDFPRLLADPENIRPNVHAYCRAFSDNARDIFERYDFDKQVDKLHQAGLLYQVTQRFAAVDLHPAAVDNYHMGLIFEELIRRFAELSNETAGEHYTPRDVIRLMVRLLFPPGDEIMARPGAVRSIYDPAAGTGGMLSIAGEYIHEHNPSAVLAMHGQELNPESYAICKADMLIKGQDVGNIAFGNTFTDDGHAGKRFDFMLSNPPFGVDWKKVQDAVRKEHGQQGHAGRFGPGLPRVSDGSLLFLLNLLAKVQPPAKGGSRAAIVLNGSPLFTGGAGSGESEIRRHVIENDLLEAIVALPTDMFYNTGIATYIWVLTNRKAAPRKNKIQLIQATECFRKMRKSLGSKRKELGPDDIAHIAALHAACAETAQSKLFPNSAFGYRTITVERPLLDEAGEIVRDKKGNPKPDPARRDTENAPLGEEVEEYFAREVLPHAPDAWIDHAKTKTGYEIPFNRHFYTYTPPRPLAEIDAELAALSREIMDLLGEVTA